MKQNVSTECEGYFFAFSRAQYEQGYQSLVRHGHIKNGEKLASSFTNGLYGTSAGLNLYYSRRRQSARKTA